MFINIIVSHSTYIGDQHGRQLASISKNCTTRHDSIHDCSEYEVKIVLHLTND